MIFILLAFFVSSFGLGATTTYDVLREFNSKGTSFINLNQAISLVQELQIRPQIGRDSKSAELRFKITPQYFQRKELEKRILKSKTNIGNKDRKMLLAQQKVLIHELMFSYVADHKKLSYLEKLLKNMQSGQSASFDSVAAKAELNSLKSEIQTRVRGSKNFLLSLVKDGGEELQVNSDLDFQLVLAEFNRLKNIPFEGTLAYSKMESESKEVKALQKMDRLDSRSYLDFIGVEGELEGKQEMGITLNYAIPFGEGPKEDFKEYKIEREKLYAKAQYHKFKTNVESLLNKAKSLEQTFSTLEKLYSKTYSSSEMLAVKLKQQEKLLSMYIKMIETREEAFAAFLELLATLPSEVDMMRFWSKNGKS